jgi:hypothetical protein
MLFVVCCFNLLTGAKTVCPSTLRCICYRNYGKSAKLTTVFFGKCKRSNNCGIAVWHFCLEKVSQENGGTSEIMTSRRWPTFEIGAQMVAGKAGTNRA